MKVKDFFNDLSLRGWTRDMHDTSLSRLEGKDHWGGDPLTIPLIGIRFILHIIDINGASSGDAGPLKKIF